MYQNIKYYKMYHTISAVSKIIPVSPMQNPFFDIGAFAPTQITITA